MIDPYETKNSEYIVGSRRPKIGDQVYIIQKENYGSEDYDQGTVKDVLTSKQFHPRGHKVRLENGLVGRVQKFADQGDVRPIQPKYQIDPVEENLPKYLPDKDDLV